MKDVLRSREVLLDSVVAMEGCVEGVVRGYWTVWWRCGKVENYDDFASGDLIYVEICAIFG